LLKKIRRNKALVFSSILIGGLGLGIAPLLAPRILTFVPTDSSLAASKTSDPAILAVGDMVCDRLPAPAILGSSPTQTCQMLATSDLAVRGKYAAVLALGDLQYENGSLAKFQQFYTPTWGRVKAITRPAVGNHEYLTPGAAGYYRYFGAAAGNPQKGYYSFNIGSWHLIALNANCREVGGCQTGSAQEKWLKADLAKHANFCTLAYWHQPRFSSGPHGNNPDTQAFWQALYQAGAEIILSAHDHSYERFAPQTPKAIADPKSGLRQFVVGTGGRSLYPFLKVQPNSQVRNDQTYGVLKLVLHPRSYDWQFIPIKGSTFTDKGSSACHPPKSSKS
jgi:acid phosphatase type 7